MRDPDLLRPHGHLDRAALPRAVRHRYEHPVAVADPDRGRAAADRLGRAAQQVGGADEPRHELGRGTLVDLPRPGELLDQAVVHDGDAVAHGERLVLVVGDVDERDADLALDPLELDLHRLAELEVERAERLVQEQRPGVVDQGSRERDPLLLAARHLTRAPLLTADEIDDLQHLAHPPLDLLVGYAPAPEAERHVLPDVHVREERVGLEDHVHVALVRRYVGDVLPLQPYGAPRGVLEPGDHPHGGGLAAA